MAQQWLPTEQGQRGTDGNGAGAEGERVAGAADLAGADSTADVFPVRFETHGLGRPRVNLGLSGRGQLVVGADRVELLGRPRSLFGLAAGRQHRVGREQIINVQLAGRSLRFLVRDSKGQLELVTLKAGDVRQAERIVAVLPDTQTPEFARMQSESADFRGRLDRVSGRAVVTPVIVAINVAVFVAMCIAGVGVFNVDGAAVVRWGSNYGALTATGQWWRLFTSMFVHFGLIHIGLNMFVLWRNGPLVERLFGRARFALLYLLSGLAGSVASLLWHPDVNSAGASGAIFGVFGGFLAFVINKRNGVPPTVMQAHQRDIVVFTLINLMYGFGHAGIDNAAHLGGLAGGFAMGFVLARPLDEDARARSQPWRVAGTAAAGVLALAMAGLPVLRPSPAALAHRQFRAALLDLHDQEQAAIDAYQAIVAQASSLSVAAFAQRVGKEVVPKWDVPYRAMRAIHMTAGDSDYALHQAMLRYFTARHRQFALIAQAGAVGEQALMPKVTAAQAEAEAAQKEIEKLMAAGPG